MTKMKMNLLSVFAAAFFAPVFFVLPGRIAHAELLPENLRCEQVTAPLGIETSTPHLSWTLQASDKSARSQRQAAYQILVASSPDILASEKGDVWDSGKVESGAQNNIEYAGGKFVTGTNYYWKVRTWDQDGKQSAWSASSVWTTGIIGAENWNRAEWISSTAENGVTRGENDPARNAPYIRKTFSLEKIPANAVIHVASFGYHELYVNGKPADDGVLNPAISNLAKTVFYRTYDIAKFLRTGNNVIGFYLGHGWSGYGDWHGGGRTKHGPAVKAILTADGQNILVTDEQWKTHTSPLTKLGGWSYFNFGGEIYDADKEIPAWNTLDCNDSDWIPVTKITSVSEKVILTPHILPPNRIISTFPAISVAKIGDKKWRVDMGKVYNGWLNIPLTGKAGTTVKLYYNDKDPDSPLDNGKDSDYGQEDHVILSGKEGGDVFQNRFNYRTFRWLVLEGLETPPAAEKITGQLIRTGYADASSFCSSDKLQNDIYSMVKYTYECLTLGGYIVDCSHRERLGYGAEGGASMESGIHNFDQSALFAKWLGDWRDVDINDPRTNTAPTTWGGGGPAWKLVVVTLPWQLYVHYGDKRVLTENYDMIRSHLASLQDRIDKDPKGILPIYRYDYYNYIGDWYSSLDIDPAQGGRGVPGRLRQFFSNCFVIYSYQEAAKIAGVLGKSDDAEKFTELAEKLKTATHKEFYDAKTVSYAGLKEQTYLSFPLLIDLPPEEIRKGVEEALVENILVTRRGHLTTGVLGSYMQLKYLTKTDRGDLVYNGLARTDWPSYGYFLANGLTTVPEAWNIHGSGSRCHTSYLSIGGWYIDGLAGIQVDPEQPCFKHFFIRPAYAANLKEVKATHRSLSGDITVHWQKKGERVVNEQKHSDRILLEVDVPPNTTATVHYPLAAEKIAENGKLLKDTGIEVLSTSELSSVLRIGSGSYCFEEYEEKK